jgi:hypothetical protein
MLVEDLMRQKEQYIKQFELMKRELKVLKDQQKDLMQDNVRDSSQILKENMKLQVSVIKVMAKINTDRKCKPTGRG